MVSGLHPIYLNARRINALCSIIASGNVLCQALPYIANVLDKIKGINNDNHAHIARWQDSVMDQVVYHGVAKWNGDNIGPTRRRLGEEDFEGLL